MGVIGYTKRLGKLLESTIGEGAIKKRFGPRRTAGTDDEGSLVKKELGKLANSLI